MPYRIDPEGTEIAALLDYAGDLSGKRVLEVGSGRGRLTWRYADRAAHVTGLEPLADRAAAAQEATPPALREIVTFLPQSIEAYRRPPESPPFDLAIMSWSL
jgi:cyclopropane fatty-acyl-phospholipid synthase-like methyltransferase